MPAQTPTPVYEFGPFRLDPADRRLLRHGEAVPLAPKAFDILLLLIERRGHLVAKTELLLRAWPDAVVEEANMAQNIYELRRALGDGQNGSHYIDTVPKHGYRFVAPIGVAEPEQMSDERPATDAPARPRSGVRHVASVVQSVSEGRR